MIVEEISMVIVVFSLPENFSQSLIVFTLESWFKDCFASVIYQCVNIFKNAVSVLPHIILFSIIKGIETNVYVAFVGFLICNVYEILIFIFVRAVGNESIQMTSKEINQFF